MTNPLNSMVNGYNYATDLLFNMEAVRSGVNSGFLLQTNVLSMLKTYITMVEKHGKEIEKLCMQTGFGIQSTGTLRQGIEKIKSNLMNKSFEYTKFASSVREDVYEPMLSAFQEHKKKVDHLVYLEQKHKKEIKMKEDKYFSLHQKYLRSFQIASSDLAHAEASGISSQEIQDRVDVLLSSKYGISHLSIAEENSRQDLQKESSPRISMWLLPGKDIQAIKSIEMADDDRLHCRKEWFHLQQTRIEHCRALQLILSEYQAVEENRIKDMEENLRKLVIFDMSLIKNQEYDTQSVIPVLDSINNLEDIKEFIEKHKRTGNAGNSRLMASLLFQGLPLPPGEIRLNVHDLKKPKAPLCVLDYSSFTGILVARFDNPVNVTPSATIREALMNAMKGVDSQHYTATENNHLCSYNKDKKSIETHPQFIEEEEEEDTKNPRSRKDVDRFIKKEKKQKAFRLRNLESNHQESFENEEKLLEENKKTAFVTEVAMSSSVKHPLEKTIALAFSDAAGQILNKSLSNLKSTNKYRLRQFKSKNHQPRKERDPMLKSQRLHRVNGVHHLNEEKAHHVHGGFALEEIHPFRQNLPGGIRCKGRRSDQSSTCVQYLSKEEFFTSMDSFQENQHSSSSFDRDQHHLQE